MCSHQARITTYPEMEICCVDCGLVLEKYLEEPFFELTEEHYEIKLKMMEIIEKMHISEGILEKGLVKFANFSEKLGKFKDQEKLVYALYRALLEDCQPRNISEICFFGEIEENSIQKMDESLQLDSCNDYANQCDRICNELEIPFSKQKQIKTFVGKTLDLTCSKLENVIAVAIHATCPDMKMKTLSKYCGVSQTSIRSLRKKLVPYFETFVN